MSAELLKGCRIGQGTDVHQLESSSNGCVTLGGVALYGDYNVIAHSDGDVLIHAIADALLGAASMGDIGAHYPANRIPKGFPSVTMLRDIRQYYTEHGFEIINIDSTVVGEKPKIAEHAADMASTIADWLKIPWNQVNVKATTTDNLGCLGRSEGIAAQAAALIQVKSV